MNLIDKKLEHGKTRATTKEHSECTTHTSQPQWQRLDSTTFQETVMRTPQMSFMKLSHDPNEPQHAKRTATQNMCRVCKKTETLKSETFELRRPPTSQRPHMCQETRWRKTKTHPTRAMPSGIQLSQGCHTMIPKTSTQTQLSRTPRMLRKEPQKVSGDVFHQKHQLLTFASTGIPGFTHHTHTHTYTWDTSVKKQLETNARKDMRRRAMHRQIPPRKAAVGQLTFGNKIENPFRRATRAWIITILGALWTTTLICLANHGTRIGGWTLNADADVTNGEKSNLQREIHLRQAHRRTSMNSYTEQRQFHEETTHLELTTGHFQFAANNIERNVSHSTANNGFDLTTYHYKRPR